MDEMGSNAASTSAIARQRQREPAKRVNTSERTLRLLSLLQTHRYWAGGELAGRLGISERTLRRDVDRLRELGYPVNASRGVAGGYQLESGAAMPPLLLDDEEAVAIAVGLQNAAGGSVEGIEETSVQALTKMIQVMPPRLRRRVEALRAYTATGGVRTSSDTVDAVALTVLAQACRDDERLRFGYLDHQRNPTTRLVEPHRLVSLGRRWYLVAWDTERGDWRTFRVDRLTEPVATGARFRQRELPASDAATFVRSRLRERPMRYSIEILVHAPPDHVRRVFGPQATLTAEGSATRVTQPTDRLDWPLSALSWLNADFEVLGPEEFVAELRKVGERYVRAVAGHA